MSSKDNGIYYNNNRNLMSVQYRHEYTQAEIAEVVKCSKDPIYFIKNYIKIVSLDKGLVLFNTYAFQERMINSFHNNRNTIANCPRQSGKSTICAAYYAWAAIFNSNCTIAMLANKAMISKELLSRVKEAIEHLPTFLKPQIVQWNAYSLELNNGSKIIAAATSSSAIRGMSISILHLDEFAHIPNNIAEDFFTSVYPTISSGTRTKCIIVSTPNGYNYFHRIWIEAERKTNGFNSVFVDWNEVPGRDQAWKHKMISEIGEQKFAQEFAGDFLGSSNSLISSSAIRNMVADRILPSSTRTFKVYEDPKPESTYLLVADPSEGLGLDDSVFTVFDVTSYPIRIVAIFKDNMISPIMFPQVIESTAQHYNTAFVLIESNSIGSQVIDILWRDFEYENIVMFGFHNTTKIGVKTTKVTKRIGCSTFKDMVENQKLIINDTDLISQISAFVLTGQTYKADVGFKDDIVMTCVILGWFSTTIEFRNITDANIRAEIQKQKIDNLRQEILPIGIIVRNGQVVYGGEVVIDKDAVWFPAGFKRDWI